MSDQQVDLNELVFRIRELKNEYYTLELEIERIDIHRDKLKLEIDTLAQIYELQTTQDKEQPVEEVKPKRLRKPNDKLSKDDTEVQLQEGRS